MRSVDMQLEKLHLWNSKKTEERKTTDTNKENNIETKETTKIIHRSATIIASITNSEQKRGIIRKT